MRLAIWVLVWTTDLLNMVFVENYFINTTERPAPVMGVGLLLFIVYPTTDNLSSQQLCTAKLIIAVQHYCLGRGGAPIILFCMAVMSIKSKSAGGTKTEPSTIHGLQS